MNFLEFGGRKTNFIQTLGTKTIFFCHYFFLFSINNILVSFKVEFRGRETNFIQTLGTKNNILVSLFFPSLNKHEKNVNDEMILQDDENDSNIDLDYAEEFG